MTNNVEKERVKVKVEHGYTHSVRIPKQWIRSLGLLMARELVLVKEGNPMAWEITIKPAEKKSTAPSKD